MSQSKVGVYIDLANINAGLDVIKKNRNVIGARIDFEKIISITTIGSEVVLKKIYTEQRVDPLEAQKKQKFIDYLSIIGFDVVTKECKVIYSSEGNINKANFDVEIAVDVCRSIWRRDCNEIILISGDSDFAYLVAEAKKYDIKITVVSTKGTISRELTSSADRIILLDDLDLAQITTTKKKN